MTLRDVDNTNIAPERGNGGTTELGKTGQSNAPGLQTSRGDKNTQEELHEDWF